MKRAYKVNGLHCANCAAKLERGINGIEGVEEAKVSFVSQKLTLKAEDDVFESVLEKAVALTKDLDPDWEIVK